MAQVKKYGFGGSYIRPDLVSNEVSDNSNALTAEQILALSGANDVVSEETITTPTEKTDAASDVSNTSAINSNNTGFIEINGIIKPFTSKAREFLINRILALKDSTNIGEFQNLIDEGSKKGNILHVNTAYNQGYVTNSSGKVIAKTQDGWKPRSNMDVKLGGWVDSRKNRYNREWSTIFRGLSEDLFTEEQPTVAAVSSPTITKNIFSTPSIWIDSNDKNEYSAYDPNIIAAQKRLDDVDKYVSSKNLWEETNEFSSDSSAVKSYIDALGLSFTPEVRSALRSALATPHLLTNDQLTMLRGLNIGFGVRAVDASGNIMEYTPEEWAEIQRKAAEAAKSAGAGGGDGTTSTTSKTTAKNIFDSSKEYLVLHKRKIKPAYDAQYDADKSGLISSDKYKQIYHFVDLKGKETFIPIQDANGNEITNPQYYYKWDESVLGKRNSEEVSDASEFRFNKNEQVLDESDNLMFYPVHVYRNEAGVTRWVYQGPDNNFYVGIPEETGTKYYKVTNFGLNGVASYDANIPYIDRRNLSSNKNGGVVYAKMGNLVPDNGSNSAVASAPIDAKRLYTTVTKTKNQQLHAGNKKWSGVDIARAIGGGIGAAGAVVGFVPVVGDAIGTGLGVVSDLINFGADLADENVSTGKAFGNLGMNAALTGIALLPGGDALKLTRNTSEVVKATAKTTQAVDKATDLIKAADNVDDVKRVLTAVNKTIKQTNAEIDGLQLAGELGSKVKGLKFKNISTRIPTDLAAAKASALTKLSNLSQIADQKEIVDIAKALRSSDITLKNAGKVAAGVVGSVGRAGMTGLGMYTTAASSVDFLSKLADENYEFTPEDWINMTNVVSGVAGIGRRIKSAYGNRAIAQAVAPDQHTYDGVRFTTSASSEKTAKDELLRAWKRAGKPEDTVPSLSDFGYKVKHRMIGDNRVVDDAVTIPNALLQSLKAIPYRRQISGVTSGQVANPFNPIINPNRFAYTENLISSMNGKWYNRMPNYGYYGVPKNLAHTLQFLNPGTTDVYETVSYKEGGEIPKYEWGDKFAANDRATYAAGAEDADLVSKSAYLQWLYKQRELYNKYVNDMFAWDNIKSKYDFIKNSDGTYDWDKYKTQRANSNYEGFDWNATDVITKLLEKKSEDLTEGELESIFGDRYRNLRDGKETASTNVNDLKTKLEALSKEKETAGENFDKQAELDSLQEQYDKAQSEYDNNYGEDGLKYLTNLRNTFATIRDDNSVGLGLSDSDIEEAKRLYGVSTSDEPMDYSDVIYGLEHASNRADSRFENGKISFTDYLTKGANRGNNIGAWENTLENIKRTPFERLEDASLAQAFRSTNKAVSVAKREAKNRRDIQDGLTMQKQDISLFDDNGLKEAELNIGASTNAAMNDVNMSTDNKANVAQKIGIHGNQTQNLANLGINRSSQIGQYKNAIQATNAQNDQIQYQNDSNKVQSGLQYSNHVETAEENKINLDSTQLNQWLQGKKADFAEDIATYTGKDALSNELKALTWQQMYGKGTATTASRIEQLTKQLQEINAKTRKLGWSTNYIS